MVHNSKRTKEHEEKSKASFHPGPQPPASLSGGGPIAAKQTESESREKAHLCFELQSHVATCLFDSSLWMSQRHLELIMSQIGHLPPRICFSSRPRPSENSPASVQWWETKQRTSPDSKLFPLHPASKPALTSCQFYL